jgi:DNA-binding beta-propeller fold protein YncE
MRWIAVILWLALSSLGLAQEKPERVLPGMRPDGKVQLPTQWSLKPIGKQIALGDFPVNIAVHPGGDYAAILHAGFGEHEVVVVDLKKDKVVSRVVIPQAFYGLLWDAAGKRLFASGGEHEVVHRFDFKDGYLSEHVEIALVAPKEEFVPAGMALSPDGKVLYVAGAWGDRIAALLHDDPPGKPGFLELQADDYPYGLLASSDGQRLYVSLWGRGAVVVLDVKSGEVLDTWTTPAHPTEMLFGPEERTLFVACANSTSVAVIDLKEKKVREIITSSLYPNAPVGSTPNSIALSSDGRALIVANADNNNLAVFDVSVPGKAKSLGYIPVGWYPTSVRFHGKENRILVANGKGLGSKSNVQGPKPGSDLPPTLREYIGGLFKGALSIIPPPSPADMAQHTKTAYECSPLLAEQAPRNAQREKNNPIPAKVGDASPIKYCIYIVKENRTYDQVFGDVPEGNGDKNLCIFPENTTPNHHALAREFVLLDNFYVESEVSADGHEWSMAAYATDFTEKTWPLTYRGGLGKLKYPSEGQVGNVASSSGGYIWDRCEEAKVSFRSYGEFINNAKKAGEKATPRLKTLEGRFDPEYHGYDLEYPDVKRAARFISELQRFEEEGEMPQLQIVRLPNDHTVGSVVGKPTPTAMVADNDLALGQMIEAISQSKFWKETAIFVVEDDAQNGSDHVDAHRTVALVVSPYTKRKHVDSHMYSTASILRTMELILGLKPMSQFDAAALPMYDSFQPKADLAPYKHRPANVSLTARNGRSAWGAELSAKMDFSKEDAADDLLLNEVVWRSVRGPKSVMPPPVRASFVFAGPDEDEDEEEDEDDDD